MKVTYKAIAACLLMPLFLLTSFAMEDAGLEDLFNVPHAKKVAYLTFDDGPSLYSNQILDILRDHDVPGIFFLLGSQIDYIEGADEIMERMLAEGHYIALHTMNHNKSALYFTPASPQIFVKQMLDLQQIIFEKTGHFTNLCRAPYGKANHFKKAHHTAVAEAGLYCVDWHVDSLDWMTQETGAIIERVYKELADCKEAEEVVLLFHELEKTVYALPQIITHLKELGYTFLPYVEGHRFADLP